MFGTHALMEIYCVRPCRHINTQTNTYTALMDSLVDKGHDSKEAVACPRPQRSG